MTPGATLVPAKAKRLTTDIGLMDRAKKLARRSQPLAVITDAVVWVIRHLVTSDIIDCTFQRLNEARHRRFFDRNFGIPAQPFASFTKNAGMAFDN